MRRWFPKVYSAGVENAADLGEALNAADYYEQRYAEASKDLIVEGRVEGIASRIPGLTAARFSELQDLEAMLEYLEQREKREVTKKQQWYLDHYQRALTERQAKDYADASDEVKVVRDVRTHVAFVRNLYLGLMKGMEYMHFQISNVTKLRCAGLEDATIEDPRARR